MTLAESGVGYAARVEKRGMGERRGGEVLKEEVVTVE